MTVLLNNVNVDTTSTTIRGEGGTAYIEVTADNFGGGAVYIETSRVNANKWVTVKRPSTGIPPPDLAISFNTVELVELSSDFELRLRLAGSSGASNVRGEVFQ